MFSKAFTQAKDWGWIVDDPRENVDEDAKVPENMDHVISTNQMLGFVNESNVHDRLYRSSLFDQRDKMIPEKVDKVMYGDNPKIVKDFKINNLTDDKVYKSGFHTTPSA